MSKDDFWLEYPLTIVNDNDMARHGGDRGRHAGNSRHSHKITSKWCRGDVGMTSWSLQLNAGGRL